MLIEERRDQILSLLHQQGRVRVKDLSQQLKTSEVTIRNDLQELHERGHLRKTHGGAILPVTVNNETPLQEKYRSRAAEKSRIGAAAAELIHDGETIILDSGTTTQEIAKRIKDKRDLTVITNGVNIAMELVGVPGIRVVLLGGVLRDNAFSIVGHFAEEMLQHFSADKLFLAADACDLEFGISTPNLEESRVNQAMTRIAREKILVADASKFGKRSLSRIIPLLDMNQVITDTQLADDYQIALRQYGVELVLV
ncbi:MAG: DeoR/GlpR transcriptional regulator [Acidobacteria bacterium]|nr:DeoR/GlpR transcriptional regulator [Acidobacteriota bacterium]